MSSVIANTTYFGVFLTIISYYIGILIKEKFKSPIFNPLLISVLIIVAYLCITKTKYDIYYEGAKYISYFLTPATVCFAIPLHQEMNKLKENKCAILIGIIAGALSSMTSVLAIALLFGLTHEQYVTLLPKSITSPFGYGVAEELGGITTITVPVIILTGVVGNIFGPYLCRLFKIRNRISVGLAFGSSSHVLGTSKALEIGELEGAMSSLSVVVSGIFTVIAASFFAQLY
ncbi:MAG: LrgB family protein [Clostridia bacterium]|jgi:predicted murein hydrolase (TIGR00659 family)|nr:LrgB family protein [Clostridia bacterium]MCI1999320.1 LrgB family protein [Clostridia bacterium]MCI2015178.1 LrgB family protein [Clostridia bacterium]